jgi:hypothetical protein
MPVYLSDNPGPDPAKTPAPAPKREEKKMVRPSDYYLIRDDILGAINRYVLEHERKGHFLMAVFENDLREAIARADGENGPVIQQIVCYCHNEIPGNCWGSKEKVAAWLEMPKEKWLDGIRSPEGTTELARQSVKGIWGSARETGRSSGR